MKEQEPKKRGRPPKKPENRGGARPGAGRKPTNNSKATRKAVNISQEAYEALEGVPNRFEYVSNLIIQDRKGGS